MDREKTWNKNYQALKAYVEEHKQFSGQEEDGKQSLAELVEI